MNKFKKLFKLQLKLIPLISIILILIGTVIYEVKVNSYKELTKEQFKKIALENQITDFTKFGYRYEMETKTGKKYFHQFQSYSEQEEFKELILDTFYSTGEQERRSFYSFGIPIILGLGLIILVLNVVVVLWFIVLYDLLRSEFKESHNKWIWFLSIILLPLITPLYYMLISENQKIKE